MAVQYKDITTVAEASSLPSGAKAFINDSGELKQASVALFGGEAMNKCKPGLAVAIIGDSISTHPKWNVSEIVVGSADVGVELRSYITYYDIDKTISLDGATSAYTITAADVGTELTFKPCSADVGKTLGTPLNYNGSGTKVWWQVAADALGFTPIAATWSGSSITAHTASSESKVASYSWHDHTIRTLGRRIAGSMERIAPDVVLVYRGTNDLSHSTKVRLTDGYFDKVDWDYPETDLLSDGTYGYKEGLAILIHKIRTTYPKAQIMLCTCNVFKRSNYSHFPTHNGYFSIPQMNNAIREVADFFGVHTIELDKCGITWENCYDEGYITDSATTPTHPNTTGHAMMGRQAVCDLVNKLHIYDIEPIYVADDMGEVDKTYLVESLAVWVDGRTGSNANYFAFVDYPVTGGVTYSIPYGRNYFWTDSSGAYLSGGQGLGATNLTLTAPSQAAYITICWSYADLGSSDAVIRAANGADDNGSGDTSEATYLVTPWACWPEGKESALDGYFAFVDYPVLGGALYSIPYGRNYFFEDIDHNYIQGASGGGLATLEVATPSNAAYITICFKPDEISTSDAAIVLISANAQTKIGDLYGTLIEGYYIGTTTTGTLGGSPDNTVYYVYSEIAVEAGKTYNAPYARNTAYYQSNGDYISGATGGGSATATLTPPANATTMTVTYKYADLNPSEVMITLA